MGFLGDLMGCLGDLMGFLGGLMGFYGDLMVFTRIYLLVNVDITIVYIVTSPCLMV